LQPGGGLLKDNGSAILEPEQRPVSSAMVNPCKTTVQRRYKPRQNEARRFTTENRGRSGFESIKGTNHSTPASPALMPPFGKAKAAGDEGSTNAEWL
jgi:hypothetical protein